MLHSFTRNYNDLSSEAGFQFEFFCDCCGNGVKSTFVPSTTYGKHEKTQKVGRLASSIGGFLGGAANEFGWAVDRAGENIRGNWGADTPEYRKEYEAAFDSAQEEVMGLFHKCPSCNKWVCDDCWNEEEGLCTDCAPREAGYVAKARNEAMRRNIDSEAETAQVWQGKLEKKTTICPACGKPAGDGRFCNNCGAPLSTIRCPNCGAQVALGVKFCSECGSPISVSATCPNCGHENEPGTKFCGECGTKL